MKPRNAFPALWFYSGKALTLCRVLSTHRSSHSATPFSLQMLSFLKSTLEGFSFLGFRPSAPFQSTNRMWRHADVNNNKNIPHFLTGSFIIPRSLINILLKRRCGLMSAFYCDWWNKKFFFFFNEAWLTKQGWCWIVKFIFTDSDELMYPSQNPGGSNTRHCAFTPRGTF